MQQPLLSDRKGSHDPKPSLHVTENPKFEVFSNFIDVCAVIRSTL